MTVVRLTSWKPGFVPNRLIALLRGFGIGLSEAHDMSTRLAGGSEISVCFDDQSRADQFSKQAQDLGVSLIINSGVRVAS